MRASTLELMRVESVTPCRTINPKVIQFTITGYATTGERRQIQTINSLRASLARESIKTPDQLIWVKWREHPQYGPTLLTVELDRTKFQHAD